MLEFDGSNDTVDCGSDASLDDLFFGGGTAMAWIYLNGYGEAGFGRIFDKAASTFPSFGWTITIDGGTTDALVMRYAGFNLIGRWRAPIGSIGTGTLYHVAVVYDADSILNDAALYIDGQPVTVTELNAPNAPMSSDAPYDLAIGNFTGGTTRTFDGEIGDARMYGRALNAAEIETIHTCRGHDGIVDGLAGRWFMRDAEPSVAPSVIADTGPSENDGTPANGPVILANTFSERRLV